MNSDLRRETPTFLAILVIMILSISGAWTLYQGEPKITLVTVSQITSCDSISGWILFEGSGNFTADAMEKQEGIASLKFSGTSDNSGWIVVKYNPAILLNWNSTEIVAFWFRHSVSHIIRLEFTIFSPDGYRAYYFDCARSNVWKRIVIKLDKYSYESNAAFSLSSINEIWIDVKLGGNTAFNFWIDDLSVCVQRG